MTPVSSSAFSHVDHDGGSALTIRFHSGATHRYTPVSKPEFDEFMAAPSLGSHFARQIKPYKASVRVG